MGRATTASAQQQAPQVYRMVIQSGPSFGPKCLDVPFGSQAAGVRVQIWDCNDGKAQVFTYDQAHKQLKSGNLCVVSWGSGIGGDPVGIDLCDFAANQRSQSWDVVGSGETYKIIGVNGLCLDIRGGNKERGTPINIWACNGTVSQSFVLIEAK
jgi:Ricin-type beta-trefoil lectin domain